MKRLDVLFLSLGLAALVATPAAAGCRTVHRCATPVVVQSAVVEAIPIVPVVSAFLQPQVIAYGAAYAGALQQGSVQQQQGYAPQPGQQGYAPQPGQQDAVLAALQRLEQRLGVIEQRAGVAPPQGQGAPMPPADAPTQQEQAQPQGQAPPQGQGSADVLKLFTTRCASCHQKGKETAGGGFVLLNGTQLVPLSAAKQKEVLKRVYSTDKKIAMPRTGNPLTDEELGVVVGWLATN